MFHFTNRHPRTAAPYLNGYYMSMVRRGHITLTTTTMPEVELPSPTTTAWSTSAHVGAISNVATITSTGMSPTDMSMAGMVITVPMRTTSRPRDRWGRTLICRPATTNSPTLYPDLDPGEEAEAPNRDGPCSSSSSTQTNEFNTFYLFPIFFLFLISFLSLSFMLSRMLVPEGNPETNFDPERLEAKKLRFHLGELMDLVQWGLAVVYQRRRGG